MSEDSDNCKGHTREITERIPREGSCRVPEADISRKNGHLDVKVPTGCDTRTQGRRQATAS